jgi:DNA-binding CsgD family transcriptional regulator
MAPPLLAKLTPAERRVAELVAAGLSYKEIARRLDRSVSTIDHQLRSVRFKLGARSNSRLVRLLADQLAAAPQAASGS